MASLVGINSCRTASRLLSRLSIKPNINVLTPITKWNNITYPIPSAKSISLFSTQAACCNMLKLNSSFGNGKVLLKPQNSLLTEAKRFLPTLNYAKRNLNRTKKKTPNKIMPSHKRILVGPQRKGVCVKLVIRTPRKPNSAQRKCAVLRLNDGRLVTAYMPGQNPQLQEHGVVLFQGGRVQDCPGIKYKVIRRKYDMN